MKKYNVLLFDLDDTILSFSKAEEYAIKKVLDYYHIDISEKNVNLYKDINLKYWHMLERKEITQSNKREKGGGGEGGR